MIQDLSFKHRPVSDLFPEPASPAEREALRLTDEQVAAYHEQGFLAGVRLLSESQADQLLEELQPLLSAEHPGSELWYEYHSNESTDPSTVLFHALGAWRITPGFHDVLWNPAFVTAAEQLLDGPVRFWHDQLFCKPAHHGGVVAWHQDYSYWTRTVPMQHLTCWIGLDDATADNGAVHYVPGSHRWDLLPITGLAGDMEAIRGVLNDPQWEQFQRPEVAELKKGEAVFHHPLMIHGSFENRTPRPRRATVINVFRDGTRSASHEPPLHGVPPIPDGQLMRGQFFPLLSAAE